MKCKICGSETVLIFRTMIRRKYETSILRCSECGYVFPENVHWLAEAYTSAINESDTGLLDRNRTFSNQLSTLLYFCFKENDAFLDYAGGYGVFTRLMRDIGFNFYYYDPYCENIFAKGFDRKENTMGKFDLLTSFETFEHFENPLEELQKMFGLAGTIVFSTVTIPEPVPSPDNWWYYGFQHGQHISFYTETTFLKMAELLHCRFYKYHGLFLFTKSNISYSKISLLSLLSRFRFSIFVRILKKSLTISDHKMLLNRHKE